MASTTASMPKNREQRHPFENGRNTIIGAIWCHKLDLVAHDQGAKDLYSSSKKQLKNAT